MKKQPPRNHEPAETDLTSLVHELKTHQIELEMQNEELRRAQLELAASHEKYTELYDFAPIGYFTFDSRGIVKSVNMTGAGMLGLGKKQLINTFFVRFVAEEDQYAFRDHLRNTLQGQQKQTCELRLRGGAGAALIVELLSISSQTAAGDGLECRSAVIDISKRKIAESGLKILSHHYEVVLESAGDGIMGLDRQGNHTFVNSAAAGMLGYRKDELTGRHSHPLWHHTRPDGTPYPEAECNIYRTLRDGVPRHVDDEVFWRKDGTSIPVEYLTTPIYEDGKIAGAVVSFRNITEQKAARDLARQLNINLELLNAELDEERARWKAVVEGIADEVWVCDTAGKMSLMNLHAVTEMGLEEFVGNSVNEVLDEVEILYPDGTSRPADQAPLLRSLTGEIVRGEEIMRHRKTGIIRHRQFSSAPTRDETGTITGAVAIVRDVTDLRRAEEALRESEARLRGIASTALDAVILIDNDGNVIFWNAAAAKMFGYAQEEIIGKPLHAFTMPERFRSHFTRGFEIFRSTGEGPFIGTVYETEGKRKGGVEFPAELSLSAIRLNGKWCAIGVVRDITERRRSEKDLEKAMDDLARSNNELDQFAAIASHDLRAPLRSVRSYLDFLSEEYKEKLDAQALQYIIRATNATKRMTDLIGSLYIYARVGTHGKEFKPVALNGVVRHAVENLKKEIDDSRAEVSYDRLPRVEGDDIQLTQLFQNLIGNAIKFRKKDTAPRISISTVQRKNEWLFAIRDNGIGIDERSFERIFLIFQRLHTAEEYQGTGMGLALCRKIVERHDGRIWIESTPGEGSVFYFTLPAKNL